MFLIFLYATALSSWERRGSMTQILGLCKIGGPRNTTDYLEYPVILMHSFSPTPLEVITHQA